MLWLQSGLTATDDEIEAYVAMIEDGYKKITLDSKRRSQR